MHLILLPCNSSCMLCWQLSLYFSQHFFIGQRPTTHPLDSRAAPLPGDTRNVDEEVVKQTEEVGACRGPRWARKTFRFNVGPQHRYLNLCVYERLAGEERGELLIGHVSL